MAEVLGQLEVQLGADISDLNRGIQSVADDIQGLENVAAKAAAGFTAAFAGMALGIRGAVNEASDFEETSNVINTVFGDGANAVENWAVATGEAVGRSTQQMREFAGQIGAVVQPMVESREVAQEMATNFAQLAVDLGSFNNVADEDALTAIRAAMTGATEPMQRFGVVMKEASLNTFLLNSGIKKQFKDLSVAQQALVRYEFIMAKTVNQQGDAEKTSASYANQVKRLGGNIDNLQRAIGQDLIPVMTSLVTNLNDALKGFISMDDETRQAASSMILFATATTGVGAALSASVLVSAKTIGAFKEIQLAIGGSTLAMNVFSKAGLLAFGKIALIVVGVAAGIGALRLAFKSNFEGITDTFDRALRQIEGGVKRFTRPIGRLLEPIVMFIESMGRTLSKLIARVMLFGRVVSDSSFGLQDMQRELKEFDEAEVNLFAKPLESLRENLGDMAADAGNLASKAGTAIVDGMEDSLASFAAIFKGQVEDPIKKSLDNVVKDADAKSKDLNKKLQGVAAKPKKEKEVKIDFDENKVFAQLENELAVEFKHLQAAAKIDNEQRKKNADAQKALADEAQGFADAIAGAANTVVGEMGDFGSIVQGAIGAGLQGGPLAAVAQVAADLLIRAEAFADLVNVAMEFVGVMVEAIRPLAEVLFPILSQLLADLAPPLAFIIRFVADVLAGALEALAPVFELLGFLLQRIAQVLEPILSIISSILAPIFEAIGNVLGRVVNILASVLLPIFSFLDRLLHALAPLLEIFAMFLGLFVEALSPVITFLVNTLTPVMSVFGMILEALTPVFDAMRFGLILVGGAITGAANAVIDVLNWFIGVVNDVIQTLNKIPGVNIKLLGTIDDLEFNVSELAGSEAFGEQFNIDPETLVLPEFDPNDYTGLQTSTEGAADSMEDLGNTIEEVTEQIANAPSGFKIAFERFRASDADRFIRRDPSLGGLFGDMLGGGEDEGRLGGDVTIGTVNIVSDDPERLWEQMEDVRRWRQFAEEGTTQRTSGGFLQTEQGGPITR